MHRLLHTKPGGVIRSRSIPRFDCSCNHQYAAGAVHARLEQRGRDREFLSLARPDRACTRRSRYPSAPTPRPHDRLHVGEVEVDQTGSRDQVGSCPPPASSTWSAVAERLEEAATARVARVEQSVVV